jgi:hypothetical protein
LLGGLAFYQLLVRRAAANSSRTLLQMGSILALARLGVLWFLLVLYWTEMMQYWHALSLIILLPEGFLLPRNVNWTCDAALLASSVIVAGSFLWTFLFLRIHVLLTKVQS